MGPREGDRAHAFLGTVASAARGGAAHPLGWAEGGVGKGPGAEEEQRQEEERRGARPRGSASGASGRSRSRDSSGLSPSSALCQPCSCVRCQCIDRGRSLAGRRRGAAGGATQGRRPPPALPDARRPSAAAGAGELGGPALRLGLQPRHSRRPSDLRAGRLGTLPPPAAAASAVPAQPQPGRGDSAPERARARGLRRPRPIVTPPTSERVATPAAGRQAVEPARVFLPRLGRLAPLRLAVRGHHCKWEVGLCEQSWSYRVSLRALRPQVPFQLRDHWPQ